MTRRAVERPAPAKINLRLEVLGRRADGFHELRTVLQTIALADVVAVSLRPRRASAPAGRPDVRLVLEREPPATGAVPAGPDNLAVAAASLLLVEAGALAVGVDLRLVKRIPAGGGLGGGSSDAAATLLALDEALGGAVDRARLDALAARLGSDVPFFLAGGTALARGRGERVRPVAPPRPFDVVLLVPGFAISTADVYAHLEAPPYPDANGRRPEACRSEDDLSTSIHEDASEHDDDAWVAPIAGADETVLDALYRNDLEEPACRVAPRLRDWLARGGVRLSGSGSTLFCYGADTPPIPPDRPGILVVRSGGGPR